MTCVHGWRPPVCLGLRPPSRGHVAARWRRARRRPAALPPPPPCCTSPASRHPIPRADWSARRAPCDRPLGSAPAGPRAAEGGELGALPPPFSRLWSRAIWCLPVGASTSFFRLFLTAYLKSRGQAPCSTRGHLCRLLLASGGGHRKVRRPVSLPVTVWSRFRGKSCRSALAGAARCALFSAWSFVLVWLQFATAVGVPFPRRHRRGRPHSAAHTARVPRFGGGWVPTPLPPGTAVPSPCTDSPLRGRSGWADVHAARVLRRRFAREVGCGGEVHTLLPRSLAQSRTTATSGCHSTRASLWLTHDDALGGLFLCPLCLFLTLGWMEPLWILPWPRVGRRRALWGFESMRGRTGGTGGPRGGSHRAPAVAVWGGGGRRECERWC